MNKRVFSVILFWTTLTLASQTVAIAVAQPSGIANGRLEAGAGYAALTGGFKNWNDQYLNLGLQLTKNDYLQATLACQNHFADSGMLLSAGLTHNIDASWYASLSLASSTAGFFLPKFRIDAFAYRKWLEAKSLVTSLGIGYYRSRDIHYDRSAVFEASYYLPALWILSAGTRATDSNPGNVFSLRGFAAITYGKNGLYFATVRYEGGREAYQAEKDSKVLVDTVSHELSLLWRQWVDSNWGYNFRGSQYLGLYRRTNGEIGLFLEF